MEPSHNDDHRKFTEVYGKSYTDGTIVTELTSQYLTCYPETVISNQHRHVTTILGDLLSTGIASGRLSKANLDGDDNDSEDTVKSHEDKLCRTTLDEQESVPAIIEHYVSDHNDQKEEIVKNLNHDNEHDQNCDDGKAKASSNETTNTTSLLLSDLESVTTNGTMTVASTITRKRGNHIQCKNEE
jgi:hypothetical protein